MTNKDVNISNCNFGSLVPSRKELMMGEGRRDGIREVGVFKSKIIVINTCGVFP